MLEDIIGMDVGDEVNVGVVSTEVKGAEVEVEVRTSDVVVITLVGGIPVGELVMMIAEVVESRLMVVEVVRVRVSVNVTDRITEAPDESTCV